MNDSKSRKTPEELADKALGAVAGGTGDNGFEKAWEAYTSANCGDCIFTISGGAIFRPAGR